MPFNKIINTETPCPDCGTLMQQWEGEDLTFCEPCDEDFRAEAEWDAQAEWAAEAIAEDRFDRLFGG